MALYQRIQEIGKGSFGTVYKGENTRTGEVVVIKDLDLGWNEQRRENAIGRILPLDALNHSNILRFISCERISTTGVAIVTEYCSSESLSKLLQKYGRGIAQNHRLEMFIQLMSALNYMHGKGFAHRDIKPDNILVDENYNVKIADVGLAKVLVTDDMQQDQIAAIYMETMDGTKLYMAPEVFLGRCTISSDVFSMGLVMYIICEVPKDLIPTIVKGAGRGQTLSEYYKELLLQAPKPPKELLQAPPRSWIKPPIKPLDSLRARHCTPSESKIINDMLRPDHHDRPPAGQILQELQDLHKKANSSRTRKERKQPLPKQPSRSPPADQILPESQNKGKLKKDADGKKRTGQAQQRCCTIV